MDTTLPLLQTKLQRPRPPRELVARPHLVAMLDRGLDRPLTLVCAGPGFGKTTLVSSWLEELASRAGTATPIPAAWLSLDEHDSDVDLFLRYLLAALRSVRGDVCPETASMLQSPQRPRITLLSATLINELSQLPAPTILVLDDYSAIRSEAVDELLGELVRNWPQPLHLVLITRQNPPLPLPMLRTRGAVTEIRSHHLRFSHEETTAYLSRVLTTQIDAAKAAVLEQRAEGWIAGLKLATLSLDLGTDAEAMVAMLDSSDARVIEYLVDEVFTRQPPAIQAFLLRTSLLHQFCVPLCEALVGDVEPGWSVAAYIQWLVRANLFIVSLDNHNEWYRFHHLFRDMLLQRAGTELTVEQVDNLHRQAALWFASRRLVDEAVHHALRGNAPDLAVRLVEEGLPGALNRTDRPTLERWLGLFPEAFVERQPVLLMLKAWALEFSWQLGAQVHVLDRLEALLDQGEDDQSPAGDQDHLRAQITLLRAQDAYFHNQPAAAIERLTAILSLLPETWTYVRGGVLLYMALSMQAIGQSADAEQFLLERHEQRIDKADLAALRLQMALCFVYLAQGKLDLIQQTATDMLRRVPTTDLVTMQSWALYFLGLVNYQWNHLDAAAQHLAALLERRYGAIMIVVRDGLIQLALTQQMLGQEAEAWRTLELMSDLDLDQTGREAEATRGMRARLQMLQGDLDSASRWADEFRAPAPDQPLMWLGNPHLNRVRILLARNTSDDLAAAQQLLDALYEVAERTHSTRFIIEIQAMRAVALELQGDAAAARMVLLPAIGMARSSGFVRVFADLGPPMQALLGRLAQEGADVRRLLAAFPTGSAEDGPAPGARPAAYGLPAPGAAAPAPRLIEPLTMRELQVLALLRQPLSVKEIARKLDISYGTVKRHIANIYGKLGVNTRWDAVAQAEELGPRGLR